MTEAVLEVEQEADAPAQEDEPEDEDEDHRVAVERGPWLRPTRHSQLRV